MWEKYFVFIAVIFVWIPCLAQEYSTGTYNSLQEGTTNQPVLTSTTTLSPLIDATTFYTTDLIHSADSVQVYSTSSTQVNPITAYSIEKSTRPVSKLKISGQKSISIINKSMSGNAPSSFIPGYTRSESLRLDIAGDVQEKLRVQANILDTDEYEGVDKVSVKLNTEHIEAYLGDFNASFPDTEFTLFNRYLSGIQVKGDWERFGFNAIASIPKGYKKYEKSYGDRTQGPYRLTNAPIILDSDRVSVDGVTQRRGIDYDIDYVAGTITFRSKSINTTSLIEVNYEYNPTGLYKRNLYGGRITGKPLSWLNIGSSYLTEFDNKDEQIKQTTGINPMGHQVMGLDSKIDLGPGLKIETEFGHSEISLDTLSSTETLKSGNAYRGQFNSQIGFNDNTHIFDMSGRFRRTEPNFQNIGNLALKQDLINYSGGLGYRFKDIFTSNYDYDKQHGKDITTSIKTEQETKVGNLDLDLKKYPELKYYFKHDTEKNDAIQQGYLNQESLSQTVSLLDGYQYFSWETRYRQDKRNYPSGQLPDTLSDIAGLNLATRNIKGFSGSTDVNIEKRWQENPTLPVAIVKTYNLNLTVNPTSKYLLSTALSLTEDPVRGDTSFIDSNYKLDLMKEFRTDGNYRLENLKRQIAGIDKPVSMHTWGLKFYANPKEPVALAYKPSEKYTETKTDPKTKIYLTHTDDYELKLVPHRIVSTNIRYLYELLRNIDTTDPALQRLQNTQDIKTNSYLAKIAPASAITTNLEYRTKTLDSSNLQTGFTYSTRKNVTDTYDIDIRTAVQNKIVVENSYTNERTKQMVTGVTQTNPDLTNVTQDLTSNYHIETQRFWTKVSEEIIRYTYIFQEFAYSQTKDLTYQVALIETLSPAVGVLVTIPNKLRLEARYGYDKSTGGATTERGTTTFKTTYDVNKYIRLSGSLENIDSRNPDYNTINAMFNLDITF